MWARLHAAMRRVGAAAGEIVSAGVIPRYRDYIMKRALGTVLIISPVHMPIKDSGHHLFFCGSATGVNAADEPPLTAKR